MPLRWPTRTPTSISGCISPSPASRRCYPPRVRSLVADSGRFPPLSPWLKRVLLKRLRPEEVSEELRAQLLRALDTGLTFSHIDGHHHIHLFAPVARVVGQLAREFGIPIVRRVRTGHDE